MIGQTIIDEQLKLALKLSDSIAWFESHTDELQETLIDFVRYAQLKDEGVDSNDQIIGLYTEATEQISDGRKRAGDPYDLDDTGAFYRSMYVKVLRDSILIDADYAKMQDQNWWSTDILGLTTENLDKYAELIKENFILYARRVLQID